ncbi:Tn3 family transposase post-transcriptional regulator TnpC [Cupriavidus sp. BIC8F]|uniref:Tn3 family transposase post-transcriptional regulator TnpC n=1 Tax=Cupriavidus sp. BIC8F TaxID=3079014 RepID=UPI0029166A7D|nr:Tn3 family transposase post-transcriptional regulator TnpC [Cupriavidus sp. BIC8F]
MSDSDDTVETAYGRLDRAALVQAQQTYDTTSLLRMVDDLDAMLSEARGEDGLRDMLLRLHGMAHTVINGAGMTVATGEESLPELAFDTLSEVLRIVTMLQGWLRQIEPLEQLTPRN